MSEAKLKGDWNVLKGKVKQQWGELTDDDIDQIEGRRDELVGRIQRVYGKTVEEADEEVSRFEREQS